MSGPKSSEVIELTDQDHTIVLPSTEALWVADDSGGNLVVAQLRNDPAGVSWIIPEATPFNGDFIAVEKTGTTGAGILALSQNVPIAWQPDQSQGLVGWWELDDPNVYVNGGGVEALVDQAGAGGRLIFAGVRPAYSATGFGTQNKPYARFNGATTSFTAATNGIPLQDELNGSGIGFTLAWVARTHTPEANDSWFSWGSFGDSSTFVVSTNGSATAYVARRENTTGTIKVANFDDTVDTDEHVWLFRYDGITFDVWRDSVQIKTNIALTIDPFNVDRFSIGLWNDGASSAQVAKADMAAMAVWNRALNATEIASANSYFTTKWL